MAWVISVLGAALALAGGVALWNGSDYFRLDWGQAETVAGTVALSAGVVTIAIAAVLFALRDLARREVARHPARAAGPGVGLEALQLADAPGEPAEAAVGSSVAERFESLPESPVGDLDEPSIDPLPSRGPAPRPPVPSASEKDLATVSGPAAAPTVVGRYESNGASYVLFSDGTIEVETATGTHSFASMADLKDHIERQDAI